MKIILAKKIGFCFGVKRAIDMSLNALKEKPKPCQVLGPLVHNESVIKKLKRSGIKFINSLNEVKRGTVIISAHGVEPEILEKIKTRNLEIIDTTCPLVKRVQNLAKNLQSNGCQVIIIGDQRHKEIISIQGAINNKGIVIEEPEEISNLKIKRKPIGVIVQTTQSPERVEKILKRLKKRFQHLKFYNTLCPIVLSYQKEVKKLAPRVDLMLIIGSKTSANTKRLAEVAKTSKKPVYHIESANQLKREWFTKIKKIGIAGGTSTPNWLIKSVIKTIKKWKK